MIFLACKFLKYFLKAGNMTETMLLRLSNAMHCKNVSSALHVPHANARVDKDVDIPMSSARDTE